MCSKPYRSYGAFALFATGWMTALSLIVVGFLGLIQLDVGAKFKAASSEWASKISTVYASDPSLPLDQVLERAGPPPNPKDAKFRYYSVIKKVLKDPRYFLPLWFLLATLSFLVTRCHLKQENGRTYDCWCKKGLPEHIEREGWWLYKRGTFEDWPWKVYTVTLLLPMFILRSLLIEASILFAPTKLNAARPIKE